VRVTWISGWGVPPESLRPLAERWFPNSQHTLLPPTCPAESIQGVIQTGPHPGHSRNAGADLTIAWSLGARRVLQAASCGVEIPGMVLLLAPFVAFPSEFQLGGKCSTTQVKYLRRWLQRDPLAAVADFYQRAGLGGPPAALPCPVGELLEGIDLLEQDASAELRAFASQGLPRNWQAFIGDDDSLLDAERVRRSLPGSVRLRSVGHDIADLLQASQS
jgi:hypothetical protein